MFTYACFHTFNQVRNISGLTNWDYIFFSGMRKKNIMHFLWVSLFFEPNLIFECAVREKKYTPPLVAPQAQKLFFVFSQDFCKTFSKIKLFMTALPTELLVITTPSPPLFIISLSCKVLLLAVEKIKPSSLLLLIIKSAKMLAFELAWTWIPSSLLSMIFLFYCILLKNRYIQNISETELLYNRIFTKFQKVPIFTKFIDTKLLIL